MAKPLNQKTGHSTRNKKEPAYKDANLAPPAKLTDAEREIWNGVVPHMEDQGVALVTDVDALIAYVQATAAFNQLVDVWKADPDNNKFPTQMLAPLHSMRTALGLTPVSRQKLIAQKADDEDRAAEKALFG